MLLEECEKATKNKITKEQWAAAAGVSPRSLYYWQKDLAQRDQVVNPTVRRSPPNKLKPYERQEVVSVLLKPEWVDLSPREIYYKLLDEENKIIASVSTLYRVAREKDLLGKRSKCSVGQKLNRQTPHLSARGPNEVWSWDVSQILSTRRTERYYLYVIVDIWSRFVVAWSLEAHEQTDLAIELWKQALESQVITGNGLVNHKDNGSIMRADEMIKFVHDAQMVDSYSRAGVSDDNPFSESLFRTIKYFRDFPEHFENIQAARAYFTQYFKDYNFTHKHSRIQFLEPATRHYGEEAKILNQRNKIVSEFYNQNPHRHSGKPKLYEPILEVRIN